MPNMERFRLILDANNIRNARIAEAARWYVECKGEEEKFFKENRLAVGMNMPDKIKFVTTRREIIERRKQAYADLKAAVESEQ